MSYQDSYDKSCMRHSQSDSSPLLSSDPTAAPPSHSSASTHTHFHHPRKSSAARPGESILKSNDPATAALRAWAEGKQMHNPGQDGSFATGQMSMGTGAVSGGPVFLPRRDDTQLPPDELLGLRGKAFRSGSDAEQANMAEKVPRSGRLGSIFGRRDGKDEHGAAELVGGDKQATEIGEEKKNGETFVQTGESAELGKKKRGLSGLFHRSEK